MDTNEKREAPGRHDGGAQPQKTGDAPRHTGENRAPKMDGVSAGGRPQRPVPRKKPENAQAQRPVSAAQGQEAPKTQDRPVRSAQAAQQPQRPAGERAQRPAAPAQGQAEGTKRSQQGSGKPREQKASVPPQEGRAPRRQPPQPQEGQRENQERAQRSAQKAANPGKRRAPSEAVEKRGQPQPSRAPQKRSAEPAKKKKANTAQRSRGDSGYQPYRRANERRKAQRSSNLRAFFSDQNPVLKWFERVRYNKDSFAEDSDLARQRRARRAAEEEKRRRRQSRFSTPAVIYTQPAAFNRDRLIVQLISVLTVVVALMLGLSVFFKVGRITVSGAEVYQPWSVVEASGISKGENLLTLSRARATSQILANLPYVKTVRIGIKLPDTVNIEIEESNVAYAIKDDQGTWWLMDSDAKVTEMINNSVAGNYTQVLGVTLSAPKVGETGVPTEAQAETVETQPGEETLPTVAPIVVTGAERLAVAQEILKALEANDIVGGAASVDVSHVDDIVLWYGSQYQVNLGNSDNITYKIACMYDAILQMSDYQTGILDVSFTQWENQVALTPFE